MTAKLFKAVKLYPDKVDPATGEVGLARIEERMRITGRDFSGEVRALLTYADKNLKPRRADSDKKT